MKIIKLFENFYLDRLKSGIDDVLVELKDNGFNVRKMVSDNYISIHIITTGDLFEFSYIEEYVIMLVDYVNTYLPKYKDDVKFIGFDVDLYKVVESDSIDLINTRLAWNEAEDKEYKLRTFKVSFGDTKFTKVIAESLSSSIMTDMIRNDKELNKLWGNIEDIFVELKDDRYNISITSYNSITGLDITLKTPKFKTCIGTYDDIVSYDRIVDFINTFEDFMTYYYENDIVTFNYTYNDGYSRIDSSKNLSKDILDKYHITNIVISVQKNNEKIIQRQKNKYRYLTESNRY
jgi:hypothetical protein